MRITFVFTNLNFKAYSIYTSIDNNNKNYNNNNNNNNNNTDYIINGLSDYLKTYLIQAWKTDLVLINKKRKTCHRINFVFPADPWLKRKENENFEQILGPDQRTEKNVERDGGTNSSWCTWNVPKSFGKKD